ncbi:uncharacterized protein LODBEIA_P45630 [Lodderomyces beijingensis]|uniref:Bromo domain-containing protein n=1 Tax=Lodderomyces beijingensis TaxID=1775926 RepID=A0ABP0ZQZ4_9ASCO
MAPKRKTGSATSTPVKKQKVGKHSPEATKRFYQSTVNLLLDLREGDEQLASAFIKLPSKKFYPDYYHLIKKPVSINEILKRISTRYTGESTSEFVEDFNQLLDNASTYNDSGSWIVKNAQKLVNVVKAQVDEFENTTPAPEEEPKPAKLKLKLHKPAPESAPESAPVSDPAESLTYSTLSRACQEVLDDVINHKFEEIGVISVPFQEEVDQSIYTDYKNFVSKPMSFSTASDLISSRKIFNPKKTLTENLQSFHDTVCLIFSNARAYNNEGSQISQDATLLEEYFEEQYKKLKAKAEVEEQSKNHLKLKLNLKPEKKAKKVKEEAKEVVETPKVEVASPVAAPVAIIVQDQQQQHQQYQDHSHSQQYSNQESQQVATAVPAETAAPAEAKPRPEVTTDKTTEDTMGKSAPTLLESNSIIQESSIFSSPAIVSQITKFVDQKTAASISSLKSRAVETKEGLFPTLANQSSATLFSYKVPANGYVDQAYTLALPSDISPFVSFKASLHQLLFQTKEPDLIDGHGYLNSTSDEEFQCKLQVNDEEVIQPSDCFEERKGQQSVLSVQYDIKLSHGLNVLTFECKVAPSLSKRVKHTVLQEHMEDLSGSRHTRHQLQQMKMTWDVETITFYIVCNFV